MYSHFPITLPAGIDEAGRGCLAGPVVSAAVVFRKDFDIIGLDDSKVLKENEREELTKEIKALALGWGIGLAWTPLIDKENILQATLISMTRAVHALSVRAKKQPSLLLIDGISKIPPIYFRVFSQIYEEAPEQKTIIDGDALVPVISAASVLAKTFRDELMTKFDKRYPQYNFAKHKGYGSKEHRDAIQKFGPCPIHRTTFKGVLNTTSLEQASLI